MTPDDEAVVAALFGQSRDEYFLLPQGLVDMQYRAQAMHVATHYPQATHELVFVGDRPVGRVVFDPTLHPTHLIDVVIERSVRGTGVGTALLADLLADHPAMSLHVWSSNTAAIALYERAGFEVTGNRDGYLTMQRKAPR